MAVSFCFLEAQIKNMNIIKNCGHTIPVANGSVSLQEVITMRDNYKDMDNSKNCQNSSQNKSQNSSRNSSQNSNRNSSQNYEQNSSRNSSQNSSRNNQR